MTVAEVAAVGVAALFVPLPHAIDDHQTANARYLSDCQGGWLQKQSELSPQWLAQWLRGISRAELARVAEHAHEHAWLNEPGKLPMPANKLPGGKRETSNSKHTFCEIGRAHV